MREPAKINLKIIKTLKINVLVCIGSQFTDF